MRSTSNAPTSEQTSQRSKITLQKKMEGQCSQKTRTIYTSSIASSIETQLVLTVSVCPLEFPTVHLGRSGGSLFVKNSHDIISERNTFINSVAVENGGAISSVIGNGIIVRAHCAWCLFLEFFR